MVTVAPRDVYFRLWEKGGQAEGFVFPWKMANMEDSRIASNMRRFGRCGQCPFQPEFGELQKWSMVIRSRLFHTELCLWWIAHFFCFGDSCRVRFMKLLAKLDETWVASLMCHLFHWRCSLGWVFSLAHIGQAKESTFTLRVLKAGLPLCPLALRALPIGSLEYFFRTHFFCSSVCCFAALVPYFHCPSISKNCRWFPCLLCLFIRTSNCLCDLTSKNQYHSHIFYQKDQSRHPTKSLAQQGLYIVILYFEVHGFRKFKLDT